MQTIILLYELGRPQITQTLTDEEARLSAKLYELGKRQVMVFGDRAGRVWKQTPAGSRGVYFLSLKRSGVDR